MVNKLARPDGEKIAQLRARRSWSQENLADRAGLSTPTVIHAEQGRPAQWQTLRKMAKAFGVQANDLLDTPPPVETDAFVKSVGGLLPPQPRLFLGRQRDVRALRERLNPSASETPDHAKACVTALHGWPGVGKTTLAAAVGNDTRLTAQFSDGVLWCTLGPAPSILSELVQWGLALGVETAVRAPTLEAARGHLITALNDRQALIVIDDVWRADHAAAMMVGGSRCSTLITTRLRELALSLAPTAEDVMLLDVLEEANALELFRRVAPRVAQEYPKQCGELVRRLGCLPLAIHVAARLLAAEAEHGWGIEDLLDQLQDEAAPLLSSAAPSDMATHLEQTPTTVASLLRRSTDLLPPDVRRCFIRLGVFAPEPATFDLPALQAVWEVEDPRPTIRALVQRGLLQPVGNSEFQLHALLAAHAESVLGE